MEPKEQIIQTALEIIGREGIHKITTREVAKRAKMNNAALNYHFGTKDNLIRQAMDVFIGRLSSAYTLLQEEDMEPGERVLVFLKRFAELSVMYPGVTKSLVGQMMWAENPDPVLADAQKKGIQAFTESLKPICGIQEERALQELGLQMMAAVLYPILLSNQLPDLYGIDYADQKQRDAYIERLFRQFIRSGKQKRHERGGKT